MSHFYTTVLSYLEHYQPERFERLKQERRLAEVAEALVTQLYTETDRELAGLRHYHPDISESLLRLTSERSAIEAILPKPQGE